jgi:peptidyl-tRNA hydrolase
MKLYVIVRKDLSHSQRAVQAGHALAEYLLHSPLFRWRNETLIYLGVKGLRQLKNVKNKLEQNGIEHFAFYEPDLNNEITAIASDEESKIFEKMNLL